LSCFLTLNASAKEKSSNSKIDSQSQPTKQARKFFDPSKIQYCNFSNNFKIQVEGDASEEICVLSGGKKNPGETPKLENGKDFNKALNYAKGKANKIVDEALKKVKSKYPYPITSQKVAVFKESTCSSASADLRGSYTATQSNITKKLIPAIAIPFEYELTGRFTDVPVSVSCADIQSAVDKNMKIEAAK